MLDIFFEDQLAFNLVVLNFLSYLRLFKTSGLLNLSYLTFIFQMTNFILLFSKGPFSLLSFSLMMVSSSKAQYSIRTDDSRKMKVLVPISPCTYLPAEVGRDKTSEPN